jgi:hypothetical protein
MRLNNQPRSLWIVSWSLMWVLVLCSQPLAAQSAQPYMELDNYIEFDWCVNGFFTNLPSTIDAVRWRWNQEPTDDQRWSWFTVQNGTASRCMTITNEDLRQNPPILYVQLRDLDGTIISLSAPFIKEPPIQVTIEIVSPERAMSHYTNRDYVTLRVINHSGGRDGYMAIWDQPSIVFHDFLLSSQEEFQKNFPLPEREGEIVTTVVVNGEHITNSRQIDFVVTRDVTPPVLTNTNAAVEIADQSTRLIISGQFADAYAPLPRAIEWQFLARDGTTIGTPIFHILTDDEVQAVTTAALVSDGTPYQLAVALGAVPNHAHTLQVRVFDRAGNGQPITPIQLNRTSVPHIVHIPFIGR